MPGGQEGYGQGVRYTSAIIIGRFSGRGPKGYRRSDDRIREDVSEELTRHGEIDASEIDIKVENGEVTLTGKVGDRQQRGGRGAGPRAGARHQLTPTAFFYTATVQSCCAGWRPPGQFPNLGHSRHRGGEA